MYRGLIALALMGCTGDIGKTGDSGSDTGAPAGSAAPMDITAEVSEEVHTVVIVRWTTEAPTTGYVSFGETDAYGMVTPTSTEASTSHEVLLLGLWADTEFHFQVTSIDSAGAESKSDDLTITTLSLPTGVPSITYTGTADWTGYMVAPFVGAGAAALILDPQGRVVWYRLNTDPSYFLMRAMMAPDAQSVVLCMAGIDSEGNKADGHIIRVSMDGYTETKIPAPMVDHDMTMRPDGTLAGIVIQEHGAEGMADSIQEIAEDGTMTEVFSAWDHVDALAAADSFDHPMNWTHGNALDYESSNDSYFMAMKELHTMARVQRETGELVWALGGEGNQFTWGEGTEPLSMFHQFEWITESQLLVFENGDPERGYSQVREFQVDQDALTATEIWRYRPDPDILVFAKGDVDRLDNGDTLVVWSSSGEIQQVDPEGAVVWQLNTDLGTAITFIQRVDALYVD